MQPMDRKNPFDSADPAWAWAAWEPSKAEPWNEARAAHLYRRAAFGAGSDTLKQATESTLAATLEALLATTEHDDSFETATGQLASSVLATNDPRALGAWWLHAMLNSPHPLLEKMTLFWHGHFATGAEKVKDAQLMLDQNRLLRAHALGSVAELVQGISRDPAMLIYLDSAVNRKVHPNENFARELMELFCLGEGNYSEKDVQELARCFTGWEVRRNQFRFNQYQHDAGMKQLLGATDVESGEQAVQRVLQSPHAPRFIARKLFRFFIADEPAPPAALLEPLAEQLRADNWQVSGVLRKLLGSRLMFSPIVYGRKIRSPIDWALNWLNACEISTNLNKLAESLNELGQALFYPPNVKGWDGGRAWITSSTLVGRTNLVGQILRDESSRWAGEDMAMFFRKQQVRSTAELVNWLQGRLFAIELTSRTRERLRNSMDAAGGIERLADCLVLAGASPEMQLG